MAEHTTAAPAGASHAGHLPSGGTALTVSGWLTGLYFVVELAVGLWTGSVAVLSDAFHTFSAVGGVVVALVAARLARLPAGDRKSFGWYRAEMLGALVNGAFLLVMAFVVIAMGAMRLGNPIHLPAGPMLWVALGGIATEVVSLAFLFRHQQGDLNIRGAYWHVLQTFVGSLIIIVAAVVIHFTGFLEIDPLLGMGFGFVLLWASWGILRDSAHVLMEGTPPGIELSGIGRALEAIEGVRDAHHLHAWALTGGKTVFSGHVRIGSGADAGAVLERAHEMLRRDHGFTLVTLQVETRCLDEAGAEDLDLAAAARSGSGPGGHAGHGASD